MVAEVFADPELLYAYSVAVRGRRHTWTRMALEAVGRSAAMHVSARVPGHDLFVIRPSGVSYDDLTPDAVVACDLDGALVDGELAPSSDTAAHAYVYRHMPEVGGVVHTHSTYASAWSARGESIPCVLTAMAEEFGGRSSGDVRQTGGGDAGDPSRMVRQPHRR